MTTSTTTAEATAVKEPKITVASVAIKAIKAGKDNAAALAAVQEALPSANTSLSSINWYRNSLRKDKVKGDDGKDIPTARELKRAATPATPATSTGDAPAAPVTTAGDGDGLD